ncbi:MAG: polysaccharide biosynthesis protein, partial [Tissierellia bacterium]|nr:polysaccharide biosynthesis protein [Tissierellia bacterium]
MKKSLKTVLLILLDSTLVTISYYVSVFIRFEGNYRWNVDNTFISFFLSLVIIKISVFFIIGLYKNLWKYAGTNELLQVVSAAIIGNNIYLSYRFLIQNNLPRSIFLLMIIFDTIFIAGVRFGYRIIGYVKGLFRISNKKGYKRIMIVGAGEAGAMVVKELNAHPE